MSKFRAGIIGCGRPSSGVDSNMQGFSIAYAQGDAYLHNENVEIVAVADISDENAKAFADHFNVSSTYTDYQEMLNHENLDIVSVCTWPTLHKEMVIAAAEADAKMVWCEKPMAVGVDEMDEMVAACQSNGTKLYINHQRRYEKPYQASRKMIDDGVLGKIERLEAWVGDGWDLMAWGTHWVDMHRFFMNDEAIDWVLAAAPHSGKIRYGHPVEDHMLLQFQFQSGVLSTIHLGDHLQAAGIRIIGSEGSISYVDGTDQFIVQHVGDADNLFKKYYESRENIPGMRTALQDILSSYEQKQTAEIDVTKGAKSTEIVMAAYLSATLKKKLPIPLENRSFNLLRDYK